MAQTPGDFYLVWRGSDQVDQLSHCITIDNALKSTVLTSLNASNIKRISWASQEGQRSVLYWNH